MEAFQRRIYHVSIDTTAYNISTVESECRPWAAPIYNSWMKTRHTHYLTETILGGIGAGAGIADAISIEALENKLASLRYHIKTMNYVTENQVL